MTFALKSDLKCPKEKAILFTGSAEFLRWADTEACMFCPKCKAEYRPGFAKCSDCDIELVDSPAEPEPERRRAKSKEFLEVDNPVEVARFLDVRQAEFAVSVLGGSGIQAYVDQPFTGAIAPHYMLGSGGIRLFVRAEDMERASEVLLSSEELNQDKMADYSARSPSIVEAPETDPY
jgi:hypothetical protein